MKYFFFTSEPTGDFVVAAKNASTARKIAEAKYPEYFTFLVRQTTKYEALEYDLDILGEEN